MNPQPKPVRELDSHYIEFVKTKPCCLPTILFPHYCSNERQPHHVSPRNGTKGTGTKVSDRRCVPVCLNAHRYCERYPKEVLPHLNEVIRTLNAEYDATFPARSKRERKPAVKIGFAVKHCPACRGDHFYPTKDFWNVTGYRCKTTNQWIEFAKVTA